MVASAAGVARQNRIGQVNGRDYGMSAQDIPGSPVAPHPDLHRVIAYDRTQLEDGQSRLYHGPPYVA